MRFISSIPVLLAASVVFYCSHEIYFFNSSVPSCQWCLILQSWDLFLQFQCFELPVLSSIAVMWFSVPSCQCCLLLQSWDSVFPAASVVFYCSHVIQYSQLPVLTSIAVMRFISSISVSLAAGVVGGVCGLIIAILLVFLIWRRCLRKRKKHSSYEPILPDRKSSLHVENGILVQTTLRYVKHFVYCISIGLEQKWRLLFRR